MEEPRSTTQKLISLSAAWQNFAHNSSHYYAVSTYTSHLICLPVMRLNFMKPLEKAMLKRGDLNDWQGWDQLFHSIELWHDWATESLILILEISGQKTFHNCLFRKLSKCSHRLQTVLVSFQEDASDELVEFACRFLEIAKILSVEIRYIKEKC